MQQKNQDQNPSAGYFVDYYLILPPLENAEQATETNPPAFPMNTLNHEKEQNVP